MSAKRTFEFSAGASPWASPSLELLDELNDVAIYKAVVSSMNEWTKRQKLRKSNARYKDLNSTSILSESSKY